jgi:hypothetical protein
MFVAASNARRNRNNCQLPGTYQPGGCWCDKYCNTAGDCCTDCGTICGNGVCTNKKKRTAAAAPAASVSTSNETANLPCGTTEVNDRVREYLARQGGAAAASLSDALAARIATCTNSLAGTEQSVTPVTNIPLVFVSAQVNGDGFVYSRAKADIVLATMNKAYARAGFTFSLARELTASFTTVQGVTCDGAFKDDLTKCPRCTWYTNNLPADLRKRGVQVLYFFKRTEEVLDEAASYLPETLYGDGGSTLPCLDGTYIKSNDDVATGGAAEAALADAITMVHEVSEVWTIDMELQQHISLH